MKIPDTQLSKDSALLMHSVAPRSLYNHCLRTFVLGMISATKKRVDIDVEMAFHASILHDLALTEAYHGDLRVSFEENSGQFAAAFARAAGASDERADNVYRAILLHAGKAGQESPDVAFVMEGARQDVIGPRISELSDAELHRIEAEIPRLGFKSEFLNILSDHLTRTKDPTWTKQFTSDPPNQFIENRWSS